MKHLSQSGSSNFCPELRKNALLISQSHFSNFALHVIKKVNKGDFCLIGQFFLRLSLINFTSGSGRLEKADKDFKKQQGRLA